MRLNNIKTIIESFNEADIKSYINLANESVNLYGLSRDTIRSSSGTFFDLIKFFESVVGLFRPNSPEFEKANQYFKDEAVSLGKRIVQSVFREITTYIIVSGLDYLEAALEVRDTKKTSLSPPRKNVTGPMKANNKYLPCPGDFLSSYSLAVIEAYGTANETYHYLLNKDVNYIRQAYPNPTTDTGLPRHYALFGPAIVGNQITNELTFILGPTPDQTYKIELHYYYYPASIIRAQIASVGLS